MPIIAERGYIIPAFGDIYVDCARELEKSIIRHHPTAQVKIITVEDLPQGDLGGFRNDAQLFRISPFRQTIKLEADMIASTSIDHWWSLFEHRDVVVSQGARNFYDQTATSRYYRKIFDDNDLPDVYNAVTYWRLSKFAQEFFQLVGQIFEHWSDFKTLLKFPDEEPTTDVVYALAAKILGPELCTLPWGYGPQIVHMKQHMIGTLTQDWTKELVWEYADTLRIQTVAQWGLVHYYIKDWVNDIKQ